MSFIMMRANFTRPCWSATSDAIICPHCDAVNMFPDASPYTWEDLQEDIHDEQFHASHNAPGL
jgi:hypothetical protein